MTTRERIYSVWCAFICVFVAGDLFDNPWAGFALVVGLYYGRSFVAVSNKVAIAGYPSGYVDMPLVAERFRTKHQWIDLLIPVASALVSVHMFKYFYAT